MVYSDDGIGDNSTDDRRECDGGYVEPRNGDSENAEDATSDGACSSEVDVLTVKYEERRPTRCNN